MAMFSLVSPIVFPSPLPTGGLGFSSTTELNADGEYVAQVARFPKSGNLESVYIWIGTTPVTPAYATLDIEIVLSTGLPGGTLYHADGYATQEVVASSQPTFILHNPIPVVEGDLFALVVRWSSGAFQVVRNNINVGITPPYGIVNTGTPSKSTTSLIAQLVYDDGTSAYIPGFWNGFNGVYASISTSTTPDEVGAKFTMPFTARAKGLSLYVGASSVEQFQALIYEDGITDPIATTGTLETGIANSTSSGLWNVYFSVPVVLESGKTYRAVVKPTTTNAVDVHAFYSIDNSVAGKSMFPLGSAWELTERSDAGAWSEAQTTKWPAVALILDQIDLAGGGGLLTHPGMAGGMRG